VLSCIGMMSAILGYGSGVRNRYCVRDMHSALCGSCTRARNGQRLRPRGCLLFGAAINLMVSIVILIIPGSVLPALMIPLVAVIVAIPPTLFELVKSVNTIFNAS